MVPLSPENPDGEFFHSSQTNLCIYAKEAE